MPFTALDSAQLLLRRLAVHLAAAVSMPFTALDSAQLNLFIAIVVIAAHWFQCRLRHWTVHNEMEIRAEGVEKLYGFNAVYGIGQCTTAYPQIQWICWS